MNCGCSIEHTLLDFYLWKTLEIKSTNKRSRLQPQGLKDDVINGRLRSYICALFSRYTYLRVDDLYMYHPYGSPEYEAALMETQLLRIDKRLKELGYYATSDKDGNIIVERAVVVPVVPAALSNA
ncbi:hypothetical protein DFP72DRAFT_894205 [Ephemerocybe angulata]|uniref:Uncharacterized protein n=1 Tax=Ephemerocybe angulata TaxID=980116 RepID=A0A8H6I0J3_9AGAR|nr:hypothetical protein DFP72DRAFT_894205 [Tulosesus angulatus]